MSYHQSALLNQVQHQGDSGTPVTTAAIVERDDLAIDEPLDLWRRTALIAHADYSGLV